MVVVVGKLAGHKQVQPPFLKGSLLDHVKYTNVLDMYPTLGSLISKLGLFSPPLMGINICFQLRAEVVVLSLTNPLSWIRVETYISSYNLIKTKANKAC